MPPKENGPGGLNDNQINFLASMMQNTKSKPDVDWDKVAEATGMTVKSAKERYRLLSIKLGWNKTDDTSPAASPKKPSGITKRTGKTGAAAKKGGKKAEQVAKSEDGEDELDKMEEMEEDAGET